MTKDFFTLSEMTESSTAKQYGLDNKPNDVERNNINELIQNLLNGFRKSWEDWCIINGSGNPAIRVSSGFRSEMVNNKVGGSKTSAHRFGSAADLVPYNGNLKSFRKFAENYLSDKLFDQCIFENIDNSGTPQWIHLGYKNGAGQQRCEFLEYKNGKYTKINV